MMTSMRAHSRRNGIAVSIGFCAVTGTCALYRDPLINDLLQLEVASDQLTIYLVTLTRNFLSCLVVLDDHRDSGARRALARPASSKIFRICLREVVRPPLVIKRRDCQRAHEKVGEKTREPFIMI
jgi:hypothetical protein